MTNERRPASFGSAASGRGARRSGGFGRGEGHPGTGVDGGIDRRSAPRGRARRGGGDRRAGRAVPFRLVRLKVDALGRIPAGVRRGRGGGENDGRGDPAGSGPSGRSRHPGEAPQGAEHLGGDRHLGRPDGTVDGREHQPQGSALTVGRAVPLTFVLATIGVLLVAYTFVRLCQQFHHAGSVYGFVGATLGPASGVVAGWSLMGTYGFYGVVTAMAAGIFGASFLDAINVWNNQPLWAGFLVGATLESSQSWPIWSCLRAGQRAGGYSWNWVDVVSTNSSSAPAPPSPVPAMPTPSSSVSATPSFPTTTSQFTQRPTTTAPTPPPPTLPVFSPTLTPPTSTQPLVQSVPTVSIAIGQPISYWLFLKHNSTSVISCQRNAKSRTSRGIA